MPDPNRLGGLDWARQTRGALTSAERRRLLVEIARGQAANIAGQLKLRLGRAPRGADEMPDPPDSPFARDVQEACDEQPAPIVAHSYRTWAFGWALAALDGHKDELDHEAWWCAALLHDAGIANVVPGEDFTLRSAAAAMDCAERHGRDDRELIGDAVTVHATPGITVARDGAIGTYIQDGALLDLGGLREWDASPRLIGEVGRRWEPPDLRSYVRAEAEAVPEGRFALLVRCGMLVAMRFGGLRQ